MVVQHNLSAMNANRYLGINNSKLSKSLEKLSSGYAINRAGDNAAGLAVSEKMRSQIAGMTQAVKNAQDGISMVQTFEGALTETDSILQRMKTLATQMANGSYDDPVDRTAAQQEFLQLNDELDQIADTDFNGVVVLNGGVMSDGVKADANGLIDYKAAKAAAEAGSADEAVDVSGTEETGEILDNSAYGAEDAAAIWKKLGVDSSVEELNVTYKYDGENWVGVAVTDADGEIIDGADASALTVTAATNGDNTGNGGFKIDGTSLNAVFNEMDLANAGRPVAEGDTVTFNFTNPGGAKYAPKNASIKEDSFDNTAVAGAKAPKFELDEGITDDAMNDDIKTALDDLKAAQWSVQYTSGEVAADTDITATGFTATDNGDGTYTITHDATSTVLGKLTIDAVTGAGSPEVAAKLDITTANGFAAGDVSFDPDSATATDDAVLTAAWGGGTITWKDGTGATVDLVDYGISITGTPAAGWDSSVLTFTAGVPATTAGDPDVTANGAVKFTIDVDAYAAPDPNATYKANSVATPDAAKEAAAGGSGVEVSKSDAFGNSEALMTYKDSIILQTGARTKDAVNFTFKYASDAIGDLKADLNCTAKGLGTDKLNLNSQKAANYAIDKIDQAINKVSLVRGTFGAIQNRLEHKIDNLNVSVENLTSAESQIRDTNMPEEMMNFTKQQILAQASQSMLAQANQLPQGVLSLLQ